MVEKEVDDGRALAVEAKQVAPAAPTLDKAMVTSKVIELTKNAIAGEEDNLELDTPFFDAGLDSLSSVALTGELGREFKVQLSPSVTFDFPTTRSLINHIIE